MEPNVDQAKASDAKPEANGELKSGSKPDAKDDLKSLPLPELEKQLESSPDGLSQAEAQKRLTHYGPNEIAECAVLSRASSAASFSAVVRLLPFSGHKPASVS